MVYNFDNQLIMLFIQEKLNFYGWLFNCVFSIWQN